MGEQNTNNTNSPPNVNMQQPANNQQNPTQTPPNSNPSPQNPSPSNSKPINPPVTQKAPAPQTSTNNTSTPPNSQNSEPPKTPISYENNSKGNIQPTSVKSKNYILIALLLIFGLIIIVAAVYFFISLNHSTIQEENNQTTNNEVENNSNPPQNNTSNPPDITNRPHNATNETNITLGTIMVSSKSYQEGVPIYSQYEDESCLYTIMFSCSHFENGCSDESIFTFCKDWCEKTGGRVSGTGGFLRYNDDNAIQCGCNICQSKEGGIKSYEIVSSRCSNIFGSNGIEVQIKNNGEVDLTKDDWVVHKIDSEEVAPWNTGVKVGELGFVYNDLSTKANNYSSGEHTVEIGLNDSDSETLIIVCP